MSVLYLFLSLSSIQKNNMFGILSIITEILYTNLIHMPHCRHQNFKELVKVAICRNIIVTHQKSKSYYDSESNKKVEIWPTKRWNFPWKWPKNTVNFHVILGTSFPTIYYIWKFDGRIKSYSLYTLGCEDILNIVTKILWLRSWIPIRIPNPKKNDSYLCNESYLQMKSMCESYDSILISSKLTIHAIWLSENSYNR